MQVSSAAQASQMTKRPKPQMTQEAREKIQDFKEKMSKAKNGDSQKSSAAKPQASSQLGLSGQEALALRKQAAS